MLYMNIIYKYYSPLYSTFVHLYFFFGGEFLLSNFCFLSMYIAVFKLHIFFFNGESNLSPGGLLFTDHRSPITFHF
jgi:hypothetical protein